MVGMEALTWLARGWLVMMALVLVWSVVMLVKDHIEARRKYDDLIEKLEREDWWLEAQIGRLDEEEDDD